MKTKELVNIMFSLSLHPLIVKPSRITKDAATLIDNIFTNVTDVKIVSGLLVTDVSDHLLVFVVLKMNKRFKAGANTQTGNLVRMKSREAITALKADLVNYDWQEIYVDDINQS